MHPQSQPQYVQLCTTDEFANFLMKLITYDWRLVKIFAA